jgi:hypothetical protein
MTEDTKVAIRELTETEITSVAGGGASFDDIPYCGTVGPRPHPWVTQLLIQQVSLPALQVTAF